MSTLAVLALSTIVARQAALDAAAANPPKGSQAAARIVAMEYLKGQFDTSRVTIEPLEVVSAKSDAVSYKTRIGGRKCDLDLVPNNNANDQGWVVKRIGCHG